MSKHASLEFQPPNSPEFNILGLVLLSGIKLLWGKFATRNVREILKEVQDEYDKHSAQKIGENFLMLQNCMECPLEKKQKVSPENEPKRTFYYRHIARSIQFLWQFSRFP